MKKAIQLRLELAPDGQDGREVGREGGKKSTTGIRLQLLKGGFDILENYLVALLNTKHS